MTEEHRHEFKFTEIKFKVQRYNPENGKVPHFDYFTVPFRAGMTPPKLVSGTPPTYTRQALEARVEGTMIVQCVITRSGTVRDCRVLQTVPFMEEAVVNALVTRRYSPVTQDGVAIDVAYVFRVHLVMP